MMHQLIRIQNLSLFFPHKICFEGFSTQISSGSRIAIIGRNGAGKSMLLNMLQGKFLASTGDVNIPDDVVCGYVPQLVDAFDSLSGGQRFDKVLTQALSLDPNVLLLDEPTNHLDRNHRHNLLKLLHKYSGTLIIVSHDLELLRTCVDTLWHIDEGKIRIFSGRYDDYMHERRIKYDAIQQKLARLNRQQKDLHQALMKEQVRAKKSNLRGEKSIRERKWPTIVSDEKAKRAIESSGKKKKVIREERMELLDNLAKLAVPEIIIPKFSLSATECDDQFLLSIRDGSVGYAKQVAVLKHINFSLFSKDRLAITGDNGSGKSTLMKAILGDATVLKEGDWLLLKRQDIGYLDQHYANLPLHKTVLEAMSDCMLACSHAEIRRHLNDFLFRKNEEVNASIAMLSGGEKVRLSLARIAAQTPKLLMLDEITNNLDLETREHLIQVLRDYPAAMIVISHDADFLERIGVRTFYTLPPD